MDKMAVWEAIRKPPDSALKPIVGGRLAGKSDINPQWRLQAMTEQFGPCGVGWRYTIDKLWPEPLPDGQVFAHALVSVYIKADGEWSEPIPGIGGNMLVEQEKSGLHASDEGYKMAVTDALSVAMKALGMAADVYAGQMDGSKYSQVAGRPSNHKAPPATDEDLERKRKQYFAKARDVGYTPDQAKQAIKENYDLESFNDATLEQLEKACAHMDRKKAERG